MVWNIPQHPDLFLKNFQCQSVFDRLLLKFLMLDVAVWVKFIVSTKFYKKLKKKK